jgi:hypothetical protein
MSAPVKERPILFNAAMMRALLAGKKTQTRRLVKPQPLADHSPLVDIALDRSGAKVGVAVWWLDSENHHDGATMCPCGMPGDRLWVREAFNDDRAETIYRADGGMPADWFDAGSKWRPSIFMPRARSRIALEVTGVRVERVGAISEADAAAEGVSPPQRTPGDMRDMAHRLAFADLWISINGAASWKLNPFVWVVEFKEIACLRRE